MMRTIGGDASASADIVLEEAGPRKEGERPPEAAGGHPRMRAHIFWSLFGVAMAVLVVMAVAMALIMHRSLMAQTERDLARTCAMAATAVEGASDPVEAVAALDLGDARLTLIDADGTVLYDSVEPAGGMDNHAERPEVVEARETGSGMSVRRSDTLFAVSIYSARLLDGGEVLRLAVKRDGVLGVLVGMAPLAAATAALMAAASGLVSRMLSRRLVAPLDAVDPMHPLDEKVAGGAYAEVMPLLRRIDEQHRQIEEQMVRLTDNDRMRVEFTANVTHELKTPLTVISGYAELIEAGIAAPADVPGFAGRIHEEAQHLTALVNDILTLSRMDEAERIDEDFGVLEPVDVRKVCDSVAERLGERARELRVDLAVEGPENVVAAGMPKLVDQIVYNLCDNALRYNRTGGSVTVTCSYDEAGRPFVSVGDTGIGIAPENLEKVFNRFYRVDAGRSRETGGTGLGLAIVKHAARCHDAQLRIESELGKGTTITVTFKGAGVDGRREAGR